MRVDSKAITGSIFFQRRVQLQYSIDVLRVSSCIGHMVGKRLHGYFEPCSSDLYAHWDAIQIGLFLVLATYPPDPAVPIVPMDCVCRSDETMQKQGANTFVAAQQRIV